MNIRWRILAISALVVLATNARGDTYKIDNEHSTIAFSVHQFVNVTRGRFKEFSGTIEVDREHPERSSVIARIRVASIDTGIAKRDQHLASAEFFDAAGYPMIDFRSRKVTRTGEQTGDVEGDFTMHGVTKPIVLHVKLVSPSPREAPAARSHWAVTTEPLKRRDFNLAFGSTAEAVSGIGQEVAVKIDIVAVAAQ